MPERAYQSLVISGAGITGLTLAVALKRSLGSALDVTVYDPMVGSLRTSGRASAIAAGPRRMLEALEIWPVIEARGQPIKSMIVSDSKLGDAVRPVYLRFEGEIEPGLPFAHMVEDDDLLAALLEAARSSGVGLVAQAVQNVRNKSGYIEAQLDSDTLVKTDLIVAADGAQSILRKQMGIATTGWAYEQAGIVATLSHEFAHEGRAEEHFLAQGPFAVLPLTDNRISIVWTQSLQDARLALTLSETEFVEKVQALIGWHLGEMRLLGKPRVFPLRLQIARELIAPRFALIGDAAHVIHPIAGQGLNLGLRDVAALAETICAQSQLGLDIGAPEILEAYQRQRRFDTVTMAATTDILNRLFSNQSTPLRMLRDLGLGVVDRLPGLKRFFMHEAGGVGDSSGKLLKGVWP